MKKILFTLLLMFIAISITAQTSDSATLNIIGCVPEINKIDINQTNDSLDLTQDVVEMEIADISVVSNSRNGFTLSISSENGGVLGDSQEK